MSALDFKIFACARAKGESLALRWAIHYLPKNTLIPCIFWEPDPTLARMLAAKRARLHAKAARIRRQNMLQQWLHVRVGVPWDADGDGTVHAGTVMDVRNNGTCLRVESDAGAGKDRLRCKTISVHDVLVLE